MVCADNLSAVEWNSSLLWCFLQKLQLEENQRECEQLLEQLNVSQVEALSLHDVQEELNAALQKVTEMTKAAALLESSCTVSFLFPY